MWCCKGSHNFSLGTVYLQEKLRSSQRLSISSPVSVKLESEDRFLLEDRNSGPSHFHPSDISLSKPKVGDWDDDFVKATI